MTTLDCLLDLCVEIHEKVMWNNLKPDLGLLDHEEDENFEEDIRKRMVANKQLEGVSD